MNESQIKVEAYRAGIEADLPCIRLTFPGSAAHSMSIGAAMNLAGWLAIACRSAMRGDERTIPHSPDYGQWLGTLMDAGEDVAKEILKALDSAGK